MHHVAETQHSHVPTKRDLRIERKWKPWRDERARLSFALNQLLQWEKKNGVTEQSRQERKALLKLNFKVVRRGIGMSIVDILAAPFAFVGDAFNNWMNSPDPHRNS